MTGRKLMLYLPLLAVAACFSSLSPAQTSPETRFEEWKTMPPDERRQMREQMRDQWHKASPEQRQQMRQRARERFEQASPEQRRQMQEESRGRREEFRQMPREERQRMRDEMRQRRQHWDHEGGQRPPGGPRKGQRGELAPPPPPTPNQAPR